MEIDDDIDDEDLDEHIRIEGGLRIGPNNRVYPNCGNTETRFQSLPGCECGCREPFTRAEERGVRRETARRYSMGFIMRAFRKTRREIYRWLDNGCPRHGSGRDAYFHLAEVLAWHSEYLRQQVAKRHGRRCPNCGRV